MSEQQYRDAAWQVVEAVSPGAQEWNTDDRVTMGQWVNAIAAALRSQVETLTQQNADLRTRAVMAENHRALEYMSRGSVAEEVEMRLREQVAVAELRAEKAERQNADLARQLAEAKVTEAQLRQGMKDIHEVMFGALVTCSLRDPNQVIHRPRLDCQHEGPHLIAACNAFALAADRPAREGE